MIARCAIVIGAIGVVLLGSVFINITSRQSLEEVTGEETGLEQTLRTGSLSNTENGVHVYPQWLRDNRGPWRLLASGTSYMLTLTGDQTYTLQQRGPKSQSSVQVSGRWVSRDLRLVLLRGFGKDEQSDLLRLTRWHLRGWEHLAPEDVRRVHSLAR